MKTKTMHSQNGTKPLPQDRKAEAALLGSLFIDQSAIFEVGAMVGTHDFFVVANGLVFQTMLDLSARQEAIDPITVMAELRRHGHADIGDGQFRAEAYLVDLIGQSVTSLHASHYAGIVAEMAARRRMIAANQQIAMLAWDESLSLDEVADKAQGLIYEATRQKSRRGLGQVSPDVSAWIDTLTERMESPVEVGGLSTGYLDLDHLLNGLRPQQLIIVAGRPGMGKTALQVGMADMMSVEGKKRGAFFNLEMSKNELITRLVARRIGIDTQRLTNGKLGEIEYANSLREAGHIAQSPLFITDVPALTPQQIRAECLRQDASTGLDYVLVDYLQLIRVPGASKPYERVSVAAREMKNLAKELNVPVVVASQLNRSLQSRADKRPVLSDLRDSGEIEEAANAVIGLYRDEYYAKDASDRPNIGELEVLKHRDGPAGVVDLYWRGPTASYHNLERRELRLP